MAQQQKVAKPFKGNPGKFDSASAITPSVQSREIEKRATQDLVVQEPEYLQRKQAPRGGEEVDQSDLIIPRLSLAQKMSDEIDESSPKYIPGLKEGMFFNNISKEVYGRAVNIVPVFKFASRVRWESREKGSPIICQSFDGITGKGDPGGECIKCSLSQFQDGEPPECTEFKNVGLVILPENRRPTMADAAVLPFKRGSLKYGKQLISMLNNTRRDWFSWIIRLTSAPEKGKKGTYAVPTAMFIGEHTLCSVPQNMQLPPSRTDIETYRTGEGAYESIRGVYGRAKEEGRHAFDVAGEEADPDAAGDAAE